MLLVKIIIVLNFLTMSDNTRGLFFVYLQL